ncbi:lysoplasmalogenase [Shimia biformata]|uniref:lysoplasmalogenase n=1 Tax=Shimia biformata TaxID=1294299 RepID=UPI001951F909|nr:lysoplasmalogenase [Shimia biformata]
MSFMEEIALRQSIRLGLIGVGVIAALIYAVVFCYRKESWPKTICKAIPLPAFGAAVWVAFGYPLVVASLFLSALGDIALSRKGDRAFLVGLIGFAAAHLAYIWHFWTLAGGLPTGPLWAIALLVLFALSTEVWLSPHTGGLRWPVRIYVVLITLMGITALGLEGREIAVWGAFAFVASDTLLAVQLFRMPDTSPGQRPAAVALWLLYAGGQLAILAGAGFAQPLFHL